MTYVTDDAQLAATPESLGLTDAQARTFALDPPPPGSPAFAFLRNKLSDATDRLIEAEPAGRA